MKADEKTKEILIKKLKEWLSEVYEKMDICIKAVSYTHLTLPTTERV